MRGWSCCHAVRRLSSSGATPSRARRSVAAHRSIQRAGAAQKRFRSAVRAADRDDADAARRGIYTGTGSENSSTGRADSPAARSSADSQGVFLKRKVDTLLSGQCFR